MVIAFLLFIAATVNLFFVDNSLGSAVVSFTICAAATYQLFTFSRGV